MIAAIETIDPTWTRLVRFIAEDGQEYCGQPVDSEIDVGLAIAERRQVMVKVLDATSPLDLNARFTGETQAIHKLLPPISQAEAGTIRCIGLNYKDHAAEMKLALPKTPEMFMKPATCLHSPVDPILLPREASLAADAEVELAIVIGRECKNVSEDEAMDYVLGYMTANDVTSREIQGRTSQWGYSKGFDAFCPIGPVLVAKSAIPDPNALLLKTVLDGKVMQDGKAADFIFSIPEIVSYLSVGTTLPKGTVILTGTPAGIGHSHNPPIYLKQGCELKVWISHGLGTLTNSIEVEK